MYPCRRSKRTDIIVSLSGNLALNYQHSKQYMVMTLWYPVLQFILSRYFTLCSCFVLMIIIIFPSENFDWLVLATASERCDKFNFRLICILFVFQLSMRVCYFCCVIPIQKMFEPGILAEWVGYDINVTYIMQFGQESLPMQITKIDRLEWI